MKPISFKYICGVCGNRFSAPNMPDEAYGEFVVRSQASDANAYMSVFDDGILDEIGGILKQNAVKWEVAKTQIPELQQKLFSFATDMAEDGSRYEIGLMPRCPQCKNRKPSSWAEEEPVRKLELKVVTHHAWAKMDSEARERTINAALAKV